MLTSTNELPFLLSLSTGKAAARFGVPLHREAIRKLVMDTFRSEKEKLMAAMKNTLVCLKFDGV